MKRLLSIAVLTVVLSGCNQSAKQKSLTVNQDSVLQEKEINKELYGNWVGQFEIDEQVLNDLGDDNVLDYQDYYPKINLMIKRITENGTVYAQNAVRGNVRGMKGNIEGANNQFSFILDEPGDKKSDGRFSFKLKGDTLIGNWTAFDQSVKIKKRNFKLLKKQFVYNPNLMLSADADGIVDWTDSKVTTQTEKDGDSTYTYTTEFYRSASDAVYKLNASTKTLTEAQLKNLKKLDLEILRNTIFARHGYAFTKASVRQFFDPVEWYVPISNNVEPELTAVEKANITLLTRLEKYATDNYDTFGR